MDCLKHVFFFLGRRHPKKRRITRRADAINSAANGNKQLIWYSKEQSQLGFAGVDSIGGDDVESQNGIARHGEEMAWIREIEARRGELV